MKRTLAMVALLFLSACGTYRASTEVAESAHLQFMGNPEGVVFVLDDNLQRIVSEGASYDLNGIQATRYTAQPGTHVLRVEKNGQLLILKKIYLSSGDVYEVNLP
ncbi:hypothetical protein [Marinobacter sp. C2H3]|uniref:hypothetical protein n=1 Tax=Marinobacter sp. C2H3 TaxID=3119003 RepID=UPI00300EA334